MKSFEKSIVGSGNFNKDAINEHWEDTPKEKFIGIDKAKLGSEASVLGRIARNPDDSLTLDEVIKKYADDSAQ